jgi:hypothetical protein
MFGITKMTFGHLRNRTAGTLLDNANYVLKPDLKKEFGSGLLFED